MLDRTWWHDQDAASESQVGDLDEFEGGEIRAMRLGAVGTLNFEKPWIYTVFLATNTFDKGFDSTTDDELVWFDYRLDIPLFENSALSIGKQKAPISMERLMSLAYEYIRSNVESRDYGDLDFDGQHVSASWALTGEMRPYRRRSGVLGPLPVAKSVHQGGWGAWEAAFRYSTLDLTDGPIDGGQMDIYTLGLNWWLTSYSVFSLNCRNITLDRFGDEGTSNALTGRLTLILE